MKANNLADSIHFFRLRGYREPLIDTRHIASDIPQGRFRLTGYDGRAFLHAPNQWEYLADLIPRAQPLNPSDLGWWDQMFLLNWKYFDDTTAWNQGQVGWYVTRVKDVSQADRVLKAIDEISANSDHETRTQTEQAAMSSWMKQVADINLIVTSIMGAVFFTLLLLAGNTMMQAVRERTGEIAVLKTLGFSGRSVLGMVLAESVLLLLIGGVIGLGLASVVGPIVSAGSGGALNLPAAGLVSWLFGVGLALLFGLGVGALPALRAMRVNITDALAGRA